MLFRSYQAKKFTGNEKFDVQNPKSADFETIPVTAALNETKIGASTYDLQTNSAIMTRLINHGGGEFSAAWTFGTDLGGSWPGRGTGYNYNDGSGWDAFPTVRIETDRCGWPSLGATASGIELNLADRKSVV